MFIRWLKIDQDEHDAGGGAGGGSGSQDGGDAGKGDADAAAADTAQAEKDKGSSGSAGNAGTPPKPAWEKDSIVWNGQQKEFTRQEIINYAQQAFNVTQREQAASKKWKEANAQLERLEKLIADADKKGGGEGEGGGGEPPDPIKELTGKFQTLEQRQEKRELRQQWNEAFLPIKQKFPGIDEDKVNDSFTEKVKSGEVEDTERGLMTAAEEVAKAEAAEKKTAEDKQIEALLTKADNPRLKAFKEKAIADYVADKAKNKNAGGDSGAGGGGGGQAKKDAGSISEIAAKIRESIPN